MRRREFIGLLGVPAWPLAVRAQQAEHMRRVGVLTSSAMQDPGSQARVGSLKQGLQELGWTDGRNMQIDYRWAAGECGPSEICERIGCSRAGCDRCYREFGGDAVDTSTDGIPIVFTDVPDPIGAGFVESLARPGRNVTGFMLFEYGMSAKWLELLKEVAPSVTRVAILRDPSMTAGIGQFADPGRCPTMEVQLRALDVRDATEIERAIPTFAQDASGGLIVTSSPSAARHRDLIIMLTARHRLPAVYSFRYYAAGGGLISYGPDPTDPLRRAAGYVARILKGDKAADLPVQAPTKYELVINLVTAKVLGLTVPPTLLARADEVIE